MLHISTPSGVRPEKVVPESVPIGNRDFFKRHEIENMKLILAGLPPVDAIPSVLQYVGTAQFAREMGVCRVTIRRWLKRARLAREAGEAESAAAPMRLKRARLAKPPAPIKRRAADLETAGG